MALKCTNTSGPPASWVMKPKPFSPLNHFTVPVVMAIPLSSWPKPTTDPVGDGLGSMRAGRESHPKCRCPRREPYHAGADTWASLGAVAHVTPTSWHLTSG